MDRAMAAALQRLGKTWETLDPSKEYPTTEAHSVLRCADEPGMRGCVFLENTPSGPKRWQQLYLAMALFDSPEQAQARIASLRGNAQVQETVYRGLPAFTQVLPPDGRDVNPCAVSTKRTVSVFAGQVMIIGSRLHVCEEEESCGECVPAPAGPMGQELDVLLEEAQRAGLIAPGMLK